MPMSAPDYAWHFTPGNEFEDEPGVTGTLAVVPGGELWLPTGRVVACDPFVELGCGEAEPFVAEVAPGRYGVECAVATLTDPEEPEPDGPPHRRIAAARLVIKDTPTESWEIGTRAGQDPAELGDDEFFGYPVDVATGCFYDAACDGTFPRSEEEEGLLWDTLYSADWFSGPQLITDPSTGHTVAAFMTGWGDGTYPTWVGRDAAGEVTCFVTDFFVVPAEAVRASA
ncbi:DUF4241 domain-containing protein [Streptomyces sp. NPDC055709]